jgi:hypothetical protein
MNKKYLAFSVVSLLFANLAMAQQAAPLAVAVPLEEGGMLAIAVACLAVGIRIIQRKRNR